MKNDDGEVNDLLDKLKKQKIQPKEIIKILDERKLSEKAISKLGWWIYLIWIILCFSPALAKYSQWKYISFLNKIPSYIFPNIVIYIAVAFFIGALILTVWSSQYNIRKGGVRSEDYTIILFRSGPYRLLRDPSNLAWSVFSITIPIILSKWTPFTFLSIIGLIYIFLDNLITGYFYMVTGMFIALLMTLLLYRNTIQIHNSIVRYKDDIKKSILDEVETIRSTSSSGMVGFVISANILLKRMLFPSCFSSGLFVCSSIYF